MVGHVEPDFGERMLPPARQRSTERAAGREDYFDAEDWASAQGSFHEAAAPAVAPAAAPPRSPTIADSPSAASPPPPPKLRFPERSPELVPSSIVVDEYSVGGVFEPASDSASSRCCAELVLLGLYLRACYRWSAYESHAMLIHWSCPHSFAQQPQPQQLRAWVIRLNPGYWAMFMCTVPFLVVGMVFHDMIGQGPSHFEPGADGHPAGTPTVAALARARRQAESVAEKHIRVHWLYMTDAFYALELCMGIGLFIALLARGGGWSHELTDVLCSDLLLPLGMIGGNVFFLSAIKGKRHWTTRYFILVNGCYALSKVILFAYYMSVILQLPKSAQYAGYMVLYLMETSMFVLAVWIYSSLWKGYQDFEFEAALAAAEEAAAETDRAAHLSDGSGSSRADSGSGVGGSGREGGKGVDRRALLVRLKKESSLNLLGVDSLKRAIESVTDRIEARQASARRVALWVPCMCRDEVPLVTLGLMVLTCALIWAAMLSSIYMHTGAFAGMVTVNDLSDSILRLPEHRPLMTDLGVFNGSDAAIF